MVGLTHVGLLVSELLELSYQSHPLAANEGEGFKALHVGRPADVERCPMTSRSGRQSDLLHVSCQRHWVSDRLREGRASRTRQAWCICPMVSPM